MRVAKAEVYKSFKNSMTAIARAAGGDKRTSRAEMTVALGKMKGTAKALTDLVYRIVDHRDAAAGASVTAADLASAMTYAKATLVDKYDLNNNGLSAAEIKPMSRTAKLAVKAAEERAVAKAQRQARSGAAVSGGEGSGGFRISGGEGSSGFRISGGE